MSAAEELSHAEAQLETAHEAAMAARQAFIESPDVKSEEAVEEAERHVRRAERFRDARAAAAEREREAQALQQREEARASRLDLLEQRSRLLAATGNRLREVVNLYATLNDAVAALDALVDDDARLCRAFNGLGERAGERDQQQPLSAETLRLIVNAELGAAWDDAPRGEADLNATFAAISRLEVPGTPGEVYRRIENALCEAEHALGAAPLCRWLATMQEPAWDDRSPAAERARQAMKLREQFVKETWPHERDS